MHQLLQPPDWAAPKGYANGIAVSLTAGSQLIFTGGQIGWNAQQQFASDDFIAQTKQALLNVRAILEAAGAAPEHMTRMTWYITDCDEYNSRLRELGGVYREVMGKNFPTMSCVGVSRLVEVRAKVEIEVTAVKP
jgi:enamine deaminase RidA (YjgF/YER057c/UK114 family)